MSSNPSSRLNAMWGFQSVEARRMSPRSSWTPSVCTSWPVPLSVDTTSYSVRDAMAPAVQVVHRLHGQEHHEVDLRGLLRIGHAEVEVAATLDDLLEELID